MFRLVYHRQSCSEELATDGEQAQPMFSAVGTELQWLLPDQVEPVGMPNVLSLQGEGGGSVECAVGLWRRDELLSRSPLWFALAGFLRPKGTAVQIDGGGF